MYHQNYGATIDDAEDLDLVMSMYNLIEYSSNYSETTGSLWFHSKEEATDFIIIIPNTNDFKSFKYKAKLLGKTESQPNPNHANGILKNTATAVSLKYLSNFWRSLWMPLINCKVELKLKWTKYCVLSAAGNDKITAGSNNVIFTIKDTKLYVPEELYQQKTIKNYQNFLVKDLKYPFIGMNIKQKARTKIQQMNIDTLLKQILLK